MRGLGKGGKGSWSRYDDAIPHPGLKASPSTLPRLLSGLQFHLLVASQEQGCSFHLDSQSKSPAEPTYSFCPPAWRGTIPEGLDSYMGHSVSQHAELTRLSLPLLSLALLNTMT